MKQNQAKIMEEFEDMEEQLRELKQIADTPHQKVSGETFHCEACRVTHRMREVLNG